MQRAFFAVKLAVSRIDVVAQDDEGDVRFHRAHRAHHLQAGAAALLNVEHHHVRAGGQDAVYSLFGRLRLADHTNRLIAQHLLHPLADRRRVFGQKNCKGGGALHHAITLAR